MTGIGLIFQSFATREQFKAQSASLKAQAAAREHDAKLQELAAQSQEARERMQSRRRVGAIRAAAGASGVLVGVGSPLAVELEEARIGEFNAQLSGYSQRLAASQNRYQSALLRTEAKNVRRVGEYVANTQLAAGIVSTAASIATMGMGGGIGFGG